MRNGKSAGSSRMCWSFPYHVNWSPRSKSATAMAGVVRQAEVPQRHLDGRLLGVVRIERNRHQNDCPVIRVPLAIQQNLIVEGIVEAEPEMRLQRGIQPAQTVERGDLRDDVAGCREVARIEARTSPSRDTPPARAAAPPRIFRSRNTSPTAPTASPPAPPGSGTPLGPRSADTPG